MFITANQIRTLFLEYFQKHQHKIVASSSLVPNDDPTLLFTNAGMVQFKSVFLGTETRPYQRATSSQRCVRAGGKHNDLERVGYTARHHTFFEMLGNFSFGDYFKQDAIRFAWDFLTNILKLPPEKLWITVYKEDQDAANIWLNDIKIDPARFSRLGDDSNFWAMGATGPCGPCTEIFYDHGENIFGSPPGTPDEDGDRYVEIWNLVFMEYNRDESGTLTPLPKPSVDTGMGLERITAVMQNVHNNYDTDLFIPLIESIAQLVGNQDLSLNSLRVIADHIRSCAFLIMDGITPSNEGRGYVLRRIIRRALRHGSKLKLPQPFFYKLVEPLTKIMGDAYPELKNAVENIKHILRREEEQFSVTLEQGLKLFEQGILSIKNNIIPGELVFKLYDTYGFPADLTADIARERDLKIDEVGFEKCMNEQRERSREASQFDTQLLVTQTDAATQFTGYQHHLADKIQDTSNIVSIFSNNRATKKLTAGESGMIILAKTPFYAESGGQIGDQGILFHNENIFHVTDTQKQGETIIHMGQMIGGTLQVDDLVTAEINLERRRKTVLNHTATHLLHHALRKILGKHVIQKGSLVAPDRLRFDFSYPGAIKRDDLEKIEYLVNADIRHNYPGKVHTTSQDQAIAEGALALFGEKYGEAVRVVKFGHSVELCGGTHAHATGEIGLFKIISETGVASGIRRIEAVTGEGALDWIKHTAEEAQQKIQQAEEKYRQLEKQMLQLKEQLNTHLSQNLLSTVREVAGVQVLTAILEQQDSRGLRHLMDQLKNQLKSGVIVLASVMNQRVTLVAGVTKNYTPQMKAGELINRLAAEIGGKGGGRPDLAEGGGNEPEKLPLAFASIDAWVQEKMAEK